MIFIANLLNKLKNKPVWISILIIICYILPYIIFYDNGHYLIHDNMDSVFVWYKVLVNSGQMFASNQSPILSFMDGVPRSSFPSELSITTWLYALVGPLNSYIIERFIIALIAYWGMFQLLKNHVIPRVNIWVISGVSLSFSLLPFWPYGGLSVAGIPLVAYALLNLHSNNKRIINWLILLLFSLYSSLILSGFFLLLWFTILLIYDIIKLKKLNFTFFSGLIFLSLTYIFTHYRLFINFFFKKDYYTSHRTEFAFKIQDFNESFKKLKDIFLNGQYHAHSLHDLIIIPTVLLGAVILFNTKLSFKKYNLILVMVIVNSIIYGYIKWHKITPFLSPIFDKIPMQFDRFYFLNPVLWYVLFAISLAVIYEEFRSGKTIVTVLICFQFLYVIKNHEFILNSTGPSFRDFFAKEQFKKIKSTIGQPLESYKIVSIGLHPSISQFNGFSTLDGYSADYPLEYKHKFRSLIEKELHKNKKIEEYFDNWGSRAYVFSSDDIGYLNYKGNNIVLDSFDFNVDIFSKLGGKYIVSAVQIDTTYSSKLNLVNKFTAKDSAWDVYLYGIK